MKVTKRHLYLVLALSVLVNVGTGLAVLSGLDREPARKERPDPPHSSLLGEDTIPPEREIKRTEVLNTLAEKFGCQSYLEIGQGRRSRNFDWIDCRIKIGVDPDSSLNAAYQMTSDEFFEINKQTFDLIFIDGLHDAGQVERDVLNALEVLNESGTIMLHDCNPTSESMQVVPRQQSVWTGDVWKAWVKLRATRGDLEMVTVDVDRGCGIIRRGKQRTIEIPEQLTYQALDADRKNLLNLVEINDFLVDLRARGD